MLVLPYSSIISVPLSYFCLNTNRFMYIRQYPFVLYKLFMKKRLHGVFLPPPSRQFHSHSIPEPLVSTLIFAISSCSSSSHCRVIHGRVIKSVNYCDGFIGDQLVSCYAKLGCIKDAGQLFDAMLDKDLVSWNNLITWFSRSGYVDKCLNALFRMKFEVGIKPNEVTIIAVISACTNRGALDEGKYIHGFALKLGLSLEAKVVNSLTNMYGKYGNLNAACQLFGTMISQNLVSCNLRIAIYTKNGFARLGIDHFNMMRRNGIKPDDGTMAALFQACTAIGIGKLGEGVHGLLINCGLSSSLTVSTVLLDMYSKLGRLNDSLKVFEELINPDRVAWTAMLAGYAVHGLGKEAVELFENMVREGVEPDHVTFTHLLSACSHAGLVKQGKNYFKTMAEVYGVEPRLDHYSCMVDLLGRSGLLNDAYELIRSMPMEPNSGVWGALFGACRVYGNIELGKEVAEKLFALDPSDCRNYTMLSNIYSAAGLWRNAAKVRALMKDRGIVREPGCSFIEHGNRIHRFAVGDRTHPDSDRIYMKLEEVIGKIREAGFVSKTEFVLHDVEEEVKEDMINKHGEKLAIAFGLLVTNAGMPLIITKNLRICGDCHDTAKLISLIEQRTIIIRDCKRFHHFSNGSCSCRDYW